MPDEVLKTVITGDTSGLDQASRKAVSSLNSIDKASTNAAASLAQIPKVSSQIAAASNQMASAAGRAGGAVQKSTKDFTGLSRVVQDLPFGFIAISNNLTQLVPAAGAFGVALSVVVAGLSFAQTGLSNWTRGLGISSESLDDQVKRIHEARQALDTYVESLNDVTKARIVGQQNAQEELVNLKTLYTATQNVNIPLAERKKLVDELQEQYPKYFGNIRDEIILAGGAKNAYDKLTASILAVAHAEAAKSALIDLGKQDIAVGQEQIDNNQKLFDIQQKINALKASGAKFTVTSLTGEERLTSEGAKLNKLQNQYNDIVSKGAEIQKQRIDLLNRQKNLSSEITDIVQKDPESLLKPGDNLPKPKTPKFDKVNFFEEFLDFDPSKVKADTEDAARAYSIFVKFALENQHRLIGLSDILKIESKPAALKAADEWWKEYEKAWNEHEPQRLLKVQTVEVKPRIVLPERELINDPKDVKVPLKPVITWQPTDFQKRLQDFNKQLQDLITSTESSLAINLGEGIASAISGEGLDKAFRNIAGIMGDFMQSLGKLLIQQAIQVQAFKKAFAALIANPAAALAVGIGLVALGALIKNTVLPKPKAFKEGALVSGPVFGLVGEGRGTSKSNPEVITPLNKLKGMLSDMRGSNNFPQYLPAHEISGDTLRLWYARANKRGGLFS